MGPYTITGTTGDHWFLSESSKTWTLAEGAKIITDGTMSTPSTSITEYEGLSNNTIIIQGSVRAGDFKTAGIDAAGTSTDIVIDTYGRVESIQATGIYLFGTNQSIVNSGKIIAGQTGIISVQTASIENGGLIKADYGIATTEALSYFLNDADGRIIAERTAVDIHSATGVSSELRNDGLIKGTDFSFRSGAGHETFENRGKMVGNVELGAGDDTFDNRRGDLTGKIIGGDGSDTLLTDDAHVRLVETATGGFDGVRSTVSYTLNNNVEYLELLGLKDIKGTGNALTNTLHGNSGDNVLRGLGGADILHGRFGDDMLFGGGGADTFIFENGCGKDVIADFRAGVDTIRLADLDLITDFADLEANHVKDLGDDLLIRAGHDSIRIRNMDLGDLDIGDFSF